MENHPPLFVELKNWENKVDGTDDCHGVEALEVNGEELPVTKGDLSIVFLTVLSVDLFVPNIFDVTAGVYLT